LFKLLDLKTSKSRIPQFPKKGNKKRNYGVDKPTLKSLLSNSASKDKDRNKVKDFVNSDLSTEKLNINAEGNFYLVFY